MEAIQEEPIETTEDERNWLHKNEETKEQPEENETVLADCKSIVTSLHTRYFYILAALRILSAKIAAILWRRKVSLLSIIPSAKGLTLSLVSVQRDLEVLEDYMKTLRNVVYTMLHVLRQVNAPEKTQLMSVVLLKFLCFLDDYCFVRWGKLQTRFVSILRLIHTTNQITVTTDKLLQYDFVVVRKGDKGDEKKDKGEEGDMKEKEEHEK